MAERWILQFCHSYYGPFLDVARQYSALFKGTTYKVLTVYLTGKASVEVRVGTASDEVIFLDYKSRQVRGLKIGAINALKKIVSGRDIALVIAHRFKPVYIACLATRAPVIGVHHAFDDYGRWQRRWFVNAFTKRLALLAVSDAVRDDIREHLHWPSDRIGTLYNRLDVEAARTGIARRDQARAILGISQESVVVANVGRLHPDKDQATLIAGFAKALPFLPERALLVVVGSGPLEADLRQLARELDLRDSVRFLGQIPDVRRLFTAFDLFVLSSDHEPFGMVLLEAMAAGVPVMATNCGGAPEIIQNDDMLFRRGDSDQLAALLTNFFADTSGRYQEERAAYGKKRLAECFSDNVARKRFFSLPMVQSVLGNPQST